MSAWDMVLEARPIVDNVLRHYWWARAADREDARQDCYLALHRAASRGVWGNWSNYARQTADGTVKSFRRNRRPVRIERLQSDPSERWVTYGKRCKWCGRSLVTWNEAKKKPVKDKRREALLASANPPLCKACQRNPATVAECLECRRLFWPRNNAKRCGVECKEKWRRQRRRRNRRAS